jgi:hypothetical protein
MRTSAPALIAIFALAILCLPCVASADSVTWTLQGVTLDDGGTASGSFAYNANTNSYSALNVTTTAGSALSGSTYSSLSNAFFSGNTMLGLGPSLSLNLTGDSFLEMFFTNPLTNTRGNDSVYLVEVNCPNMICFEPSIRWNTAGSVTSVPVGTPEPATLPLLGAGLAAVAMFLRRK